MMTTPPDRAFDILLSVPEPHADPAGFYRRALHEMRGCEVQGADGTYHVRVRLIVKGAREAEAKDVRGAVADTLRLRAPKIVVVGVRAA